MIAITSISRDGGAWLYAWSAGGASVRVVLWGVTLATTTESSFTYTSAMHNHPTIAPPIEIVLEADEALSERNICYITLQWYRVECDHYEVEYYDDGSWYSWGSVPDDSETEIISVATPLLPDQTETRWRVTAVAATKRESDPLEFAFAVVRPPNAPSMPTLSCDAGTLPVS